MSSCIVTRPNGTVSGNIRLPASKSVSNRLLIIRALAGEHFSITNLSDAEDTRTLSALLDQLKNAEPGTEQTFDTGPAGTTMRFLTAYFATLPGTRILTGSERMKKRPISILVNALRDLGAKIDYLGEEGYPPLRVEGGLLKGGEIELDGSVSSQFISALLMIAPVLHNGLVIRFRGEVTSRPYIDMTIKIMEKFSVFPIWQEDALSVSKQPYCVSCEEITGMEVEPDWSAASYWYAIAALSEKSDLLLEGLRAESLQGDKMTALLFEFFGVHTEFTEEGARLIKMRVPSRSFGFDFADTPDIVQTLAVVAAAQRVRSVFKGVSTLRIKETDRVAAIQRELEKIGVTSKIYSDSIFEITDSEKEFPSSAEISTYEDHRMAMAFAPLAAVVPQLIIHDPQVVRKSYPSFWDQLRAAGFGVEMK